MLVPQDFCLHHLPTELWARFGLRHVKGQIFLHWAGLNAEEMIRPKTFLTSRSPWCVEAFLSSVLFPFTEIVLEKCLQIVSSFGQNPLAVWNRCPSRDLRIEIKLCKSHMPFDIVSVFNRSVPKMQNAFHQDGPCCFDSFPSKKGCAHCR